jgi:hypothetical protein
MSGAALPGAAGEHFAAAALAALGEAGPGNAASIAAAAEAMALASVARLQVRECDLCVLAMTYVC